MKFKQIESSKDICKLIAKDSIIKAPLDEKNVTTDWISEDLFDNGNSTYCQSQYTGFINGIPTYIRCSGNCMMVMPINSNGITSTTDALILNRFSEILNVDLGEDKTNADAELIAVCEQYDYDDEFNFDELDEDELDYCRWDDIINQSLICDLADAIINKDEILERKPHE